MKFLWTEDSKAGFHYWKLVNEHLFNGTFIVESKGSNQKLLDAVRDLKGKEMGKCWHEDSCVLEINKGKHCRVEQEMSGYEKMQVFLADDETQRIIQDMR